MWPDGLDWLQHARNIAPTLASRGFTQTEIDGILGGNFLRTLAAIWGN